MLEHEDARRMAVVFEDDVAFRSSLISLLEQRNFKVKAFSSPVEVSFQQLQALRASIITTDIMMPGKDGMTFLREIKSIPSLAKIPTIIITSRSDFASEADALGCDAYYVKHEQTLPEIVHAIDNLIPLVK